jgi:hypothetical protein
LVALADQVRAVLSLGQRVVCEVGRVVLVWSLSRLFFVIAGALLLRYRCVAVIVAHAQMTCSDYIIFLVCCMMLQTMIK